MMRGQCIDCGARVKFLRDVKEICGVSDNGKPSRLRCRVTPRLWRRCNVDGATRGEVAVLTIAILSCRGTEDIAHEATCT